MDTSVPPPPPPPATQPHSPRFSPPAAAITQLYEDMGDYLLVIHPQTNKQMKLSTHKTTVRTAPMKARHARAAVDKIDFLIEQLQQSRTPAEAHAEDMELQALIYADYGETMDAQADLMATHKVEMQLVRKEESRKARKAARKAIREKERAMLGASGGKRKARLDEESDEDSEDDWTPEDDEIIDNDEEPRRRKRVRPDNVRSDNLNVTFKKLDGTQLPVTLHRDDTVIDIKRRLAEGKCSPEHVRLTFMGKQLGDIYTLHQCGVQDGSRIHVTYAQEGGNGPAAAAAAAVDEEEYRQWFDNLPEAPVADEEEYRQWFDNLPEVPVIEGAIPFRRRRPNGQEREIDRLRAVNREDSVEYRHLLDRAYARVLDAEAEIRAHVAAIDTQQQLIRARDAEIARLRQELADRGIADDDDDDDDEVQEDEVPAPPGWVHVPEDHRQLSHHGFYLFGELRTSILSWGNPERTYLSFDNPAGGRRICYPIADWDAPHTHANFAARDAMVAANAAYTQLLAQPGALST